MGRPMGRGPHFPQGWEIWWSGMHLPPVLADFGNFCTVPVRTTTERSRGTKSPSLVERGEPGLRAGPWEEGISPVKKIFFRQKTF